MTNFHMCPFSPVHPGLGAVVWCSGHFLGAHALLLTKLGPVTWEYSLSLISPLSMSRADINRKLCPVDSRDVRLPAVSPKNLRNVLAVMHSFLALDWINTWLLHLLTLNWPPHHEITLCYPVET